MGTDGKEGRRPGRVAENWGRQDRIRAGAVSGPWRSAPKSGPAPAAMPAHPAPRPPQESEVVLPPPPLKPRLAGVWAAVAVGGAVALAIVGAALLFRTGSAPAPVPPAEPPVAEAPVQAAPAPSASAAAPAEAQGVIRLRVGPNLAAAERDAIAAALEGAGYGPVQVEVLPFPIAASRVGYYRPEDAAAAEALAAFLRERAPSPGNAPSTRDYSRLLPDAAPGRLDIWIEG